MTTQQNIINSQFNEVNYTAELYAPGKVKKLIVQLDMCIIALFENNQWEIKPYPNWKHTVNQIFNHIKTVAY